MAGLAVDILGATGVVPSARVGGAADRLPEALRQVLDVLGEEERASVQHENAQGVRRAEAVELGREVAAEHASANHDGVEGVPAAALARV